MRDTSAPRTRSAVLGFVALALSFPASGETARELYNHFGLFAECRPMDLVVDFSSSYAAEVGLTKESIRAAAESRLRAARLFSSESSQYLYININMYKSAFNISVSYYKVVYDSLTAQRQPASAWGTGSTGTHGGDPGYILSTLPQFLDQFLVEYLRVNEEACAAR